MKKIFYCGLIFLSFFAACDPEKSIEFTDDETYVRIITKRDLILVAYNHDEDKGPRKLQLRDNYGNIIDEITLRNEPFKVIKWGNDSINICFLGSDIKFFTPWLEENSKKQQKLGNYFINYSYYVNPGGFRSKTISVDSFLINSNFQIVLFYNNNKFIDSVEFSELKIYSHKFSTLKFNNGSSLATTYLTPSEKIIQKYLKEILQ